MLNMLCSQWNLELEYASLFSCETGLQHMKLQVLELCLGFCLTSKSTLHLQVTASWVRPIRNELTRRLVSRLGYLQCSTGVLASCVLETVPNRAFLGVSRFGTVQLEFEIQTISYFVNNIIRQDETGANIPASTPPP